MLQFSFVLFCLAAAGGASMFGLLLAKKNWPSWMGAGHGMFALVCLIILFIANLVGGDQTPALAWWALVVFLAGFSGGMLLFRYVFKGRATVPLVLVHGGVNLVGLILLGNAAF